MRRCWEVVVVLEIPASAIYLELENIGRVSAHLGTS
jgi:hypothetical protein